MTIPELVILASGVVGLCVFIGVTLLALHLAKWRDVIAATTLGLVLGLWVVGMTYLLSQSSASWGK